MTHGVTLHTEGEEHTFACAPGERILHAGLRNGINLPYECATGTCGKCRAELTGGEVTDLWPEAPARCALSRRKPEILMCQSACASGEVQLGLRKLPARPQSASNPGWRSGVIRRCRSLTPQIIELGIQLDAPVSFLGGQFVLLEFAGLPGPRAYSMVNFEHSTDMLQLIIRRKDGGGVSERLFDRDPVGEAVAAFGPLGSAVFEPTLEDVVCIGGGSGIAGLFSVARSALLHGHLGNHRLHLFFGVRSPADLFYASELQSLRAQAGDGFEATVAFSDANVDPVLRHRYPLLRFEHGLVHEVAIGRLGDLLPKATTFIAGPTAAVEAGLRQLVTVARVAPNRVRYDKFS